MHEALARYEYDTVVIDEPALPRVATEELTMQTYVNGEWHRRMPDLSATSCEVAIDGPRCPVRRNELRGDICGICHTPAELRKAAENNRKDMDP